MSADHTAGGLDLTSEQEAAARLAAAHATDSADLRQLLSVEEAPTEGTGPDEWDVSRMEHELDVLRDRVRELEEQLDDAHREAANESALVSDARHDRDAARMDTSRLRREVRRVQALADRRWVAYQSARSRARRQSALVRTQDARIWAWARRVLQLEQLADDAHPTTDRSTT